MRNMLKNKKILSLLLATLPLVSMAQERAAFGPIENVGLSAPTVTVLGQQFAIETATKIAVNGKALPQRVALTYLSTGKSVLVQGYDSSKGAIATSINISRDPYVAGATPIYVFGAVSSYSVTSGLINIGSLQVDATAFAPESLAKLTIGEVVELTAIQPSPSGVLVSANLLSIGGSGSQLQSIGGSGTSKQSIGGSGSLLQSIGGSGTSLQSIGGSGAQIQSIGGSGVQTDSIGGSGAL
jgi:hypothetical protein